MGESLWVVWAVNHFLHFTKNTKKINILLKIFEKNVSKKYEKNLKKILKIFFEDF